MVAYTQKRTLTRKCTVYSEARLFHNIIDRGKYLKVRGQIGVMTRARRKAALEVSAGGGRPPPPLATGVRGITPPDNFENFMCKMNCTLFWFQTKCNCDADFYLQMVLWSCVMESQQHHCAVLRESRIGQRQLNACLIDRVMAFLMVRDDNSDPNAENMLWTR